MQLFVAISLSLSPFFGFFLALSLLCAIIKWVCGLLLTNLLDFHLHRVRPMAANLAIQLSLCEVFCGRLEISNNSMHFRNYQLKVLRARGGEDRERKGGQLDVGQQQCGM